MRCVKVSPQLDVPIKLINGKYERMYLVIIGWMYVALMMSVAEATNTNGTLLGAIFTFLLYGLLPAGLLTYIMATPGRKRAIKAREAAEAAQAARAAEAAKASAQAEAASSAAPADAPDAPEPPAAPAAEVPSREPHAGGEAAADPVAPVRKEP